MRSRFTGTQWITAVTVLMGGLVIGPAAQAATTIDPGAYPLLFLSGPNPAGGNYSNKRIEGLTTLDLVPLQSYFLDNGANAGYSYLVFQTDSDGSFPYIDATTASAVESATGGVLKLKNVNVTINVGQYEGAYFLPPKGTSEPLRQTQTRILIPGMRYSFNNGSSYFFFKLGPEVGGSAAIESIDPLNPAPSSGPAVYTASGIGGATLFLNTIPVHVDRGGWTGSFRIGGFTFAGSTLPQIVTFLENTPTVIESINDPKVIANSAGVSPSSVPVTKNGVTYTYTFSVTPPDTTAPVLSLPSIVEAEATSANGAMVSFTATALDSKDGPVPVTCSPASGSLFSLGDTPVSCTATDAASNKATGSFIVRVKDTVAPTISGVADITAEATGPNGASVDYSVSATDAVDGAVTATADPESGSVFPLGTTSVSVTSTDAHGNTAVQSFTVTVRDTTAPTLSLPNNITATATSAAGAVVTFSTSASDIVSGTVPVNSSPASGSTFAPGTTTVECSATDGAGKTAAGSFTVTVAYSWSGVLQPINADGSSIFKLGRTVPVKFQLTGASAGITDAVARLYVAKVSDTVAGSEVEAESTSAATTGNLFRYSEGQYIFNLSTSGLTTGTYQLRIDLGDGQERMVLISLR